MKSSKYQIDSCCPSFLAITDFGRIFSSRCTNSSSSRVTHDFLNASLPAGGRSPGKVSGYLGPYLAAGNFRTDRLTFAFANISIPTTDPYRNRQTRWLPIIVGHFPSRSCILSLTDSSAYRSLNLGPGDVPFEFRPSQGKGWGAFATRKITPGDLIFEEEPLFAIRKPLKHITEVDVRAGLQRLSTYQKHQFMCLLDNITRPFTSMEKAFKESSFFLAVDPRTRVWTAHTGRPAGQEGSGGAQDPFVY